MLKYNEAYIQILDIPGLIEGAKEGKGKGKEVLSVARGADLLIIMTDVQRIDLIEKMLNELEGAGIRINLERPKVLVEKKTEGGLEIYSNVKQEIDKETTKEIAREYGIKSGNITLKEKVSYDRLFDAFSTNRFYVPAIFVVNKVDQKSNYHALMYDNYIEVSAENGLGIDDLIIEIWNALKFVTVYLVKPDEELSNGSPVIMKDGETLKDVALKIGPDFAESKKLVKIWGPGAKFPGQEVSFSTEVLEGMKIRFI
jgi:hypothetical protein